MRYSYIKDSYSQVLLYFQILHSKKIESGGVKEQNKETTSREGPTIKDAGLGLFKGLQL
jgi:hypothetical protein